MEEAERLCDRVALIDDGRVLAIDSPAAVANAAVSEQVIRFRPSEPIDDELLSAVPGVSEVTRQGSQVVISGTGDLLGAVVAVLARNGVTANQLRMEQATLEDAFVALTGSERSR
jgi:ABC-2 type transport system ATP-binding protein